MTKEYKMPERIKNEVFSMIEKTMERERITQAEVARRVGAQRYNINKVMRGKDPVSLEFLLKIAESIGLEVDLKMRLRK
jgi:transcriptional regulator with XRE-family HTH domain